MVKYGRLTLEERCQIVAYLQADFLPAEIARMLNRVKSTITREIKRNSTQYQYSVLYRAGPANCLARERRKKCRRKERLTEDLRFYVEKKLKEGWSPDEIAGRYREETGKSLSHQTIYTYVDQNKALKKYLRWSKRRGAGRSKQRSARQEKFTSIHERPVIANERRRIGDWERDGMYGAKHKQLLVCVDRKARFTKLVRMPSTHASVVSELTMKVLKSTGKRIYTITNDNGSEFRGEPIKEVRVYHCDPMKPQQRGTVENTIGMLRRHITRQTDLETMTDADIKDIEDRMNLRPRKILGYMTPYEMFYKTKVALAV